MNEPSQQDEKSPAPITVTLSKPAIATLPRPTLATIFMRNRLPHSANPLDVTMLPVPNGHAGVLSFNDQDGFRMNYELTAEVISEVMVHEMLPEMDRRVITGPLFIQQRALSRDHSTILDYSIEQNSKNERYALVSFIDTDDKTQSFKMDDECLSAVLANPALNEFDRKTLTMALHYVRSHAYKANGPMVTP